MMETGRPWSKTFTTLNKCLVLLHLVLSFLPLGKILAIFSERVVTTGSSLWKIHHTLENTVVGLIQSAVSRSIYIRGAKAHLLIETVAVHLRQEGLSDS